MIGLAPLEPSTVATVRGSSGQEHCAVSGAQLFARLVWRINAGAFSQERVAVSLLPKLVSPAPGKVALVLVSSGRARTVVWTDTDNAMGAGLNSAKDRTPSSQARSVACRNPFIAIPAGPIAGATGGKGLEVIVAIPTAEACWQQVLSVKATLKWQKCQSI